MLTTNNVVLRHINYTNFLYILHGAMHVFRQILYSNVYSLYTPKRLTYLWSHVPVVLNLLTTATPFRIDPFLRAFLASTFEKYKERKERRKRKKKYILRNLILLSSSHILMYSWSAKEQTTKISIISLSKVLKPFSLTSVSSVYTLVKSKPNIMRKSTFPPRVSAAKTAKKPKVEDH